MFINRLKFYTKIKDTTVLKNMFQNYIKLDTDTFLFLFFYLQPISVLNINIICWNIILLNIYVEYKYLSI